MLILLSPAKNLDAAPPPPSLPRTAPRFAKDTAALVAACKRLTAGDLARLMELSDKLATLNFERFQVFDPKAGAEAGKQAALAFAGDVYVGLDARSLSDEDFAWAQAHVRILSGLYGLLRPLDAIQPYRLEMGTRLQTKRGGDLYAFWGDRLARALDADLAALGGAPVILNLASEEYFSAVDRKALRARVVTLSFKDVKDGKARSVFLFVKRARGAFARACIERRLTDPEAVRGLVVDGYRLDAAASGENDWVFTRPQPPPKR